MQISKTIKKTVVKIGVKIPGLKTYFRARQVCGDHKKWTRFAPPGHFLSPIPSEADIARRSRAVSTADAEASGLQPRIEAQKDFVGELAKNYGEIPFGEQRRENLRYYYENTSYSYADAIFLHLIVRHLKPRQIVEVGCGFSSAIMLDTVERFLAGQTSLVFIEPHTERLRSLLRAADYQHCRIIEKMVQDVAMETFTALESGDILFVDSSHVSKTGSDVNFLLFEVFPRLKPGVWIHIHDIFPDYDYPEAWFLEGRAWNEAYLVRAFLLFNENFEIVLHGPSCIEKNRNWFQENMPACLKNSGGSLWIRRKTNPVH